MRLTARVSVKSEVLAGCVAGLEGSGQAPGRGNLHLPEIGAKKKELLSIIDLGQLSSCQASELKLISCVTVSRSFVPKELVFLARSLFSFCFHLIGVW